jgi:hypothetical protein
MVGIYIDKVYKFKIVYYVEIFKIINLFPIRNYKFSTMFIFGIWRELKAAAFMSVESNTPLRFQLSVH